MKQWSLFCYVWLSLAYLQVAEVYGQYESYKESGIASYFVDKFDGRTTASGERLENNIALVGSHKQLPFNTLVEVTNTSTKQSVVVRIIDRGPYAHDRIIDLSKAAAKKIGLTRTGIAKVDLKVVGMNGNLFGQKSPEEANPERKLTQPEKQKNDDNRDAQTTGAFRVGHTYSQWGTPRSPKGFGIQTGIFSTLDNAKKHCETLENKGFSALFIQVSLLNNNPVYRVLVGEFADKTQAQSTAQRLQQAGFETLVKPY
ncbi:septal ring lytic transglycosylase RlpA family protein [Eisenibacter elegans]|jgi:rare lipoprotein A|uniref:septal ring lytic transglycosylase RlpA family protein n=1 Tax=Eisenibacter elegans TaxID=997 RepID=UPI000687B7E7|nr:septal ring lytic transglycosylase RlpA family protein [Eisenibacter elegans]